MKHIIVTPKDDFDLTILLNEIGKINGVISVEIERNFSLPGNELNDDDLLNIVNDASTEEYTKSDDVFKELSKKYR